MNTIRIGNGAGFWGDSLDAPRRLAEQGQLQYLTLEYLAELTLSILAHQKSRDPNAGFVGDVPPVVASLVPSFKAQPGLRLVTNGGGLNPVVCAVKVSELLCSMGLGSLRIGVVTGDDILSGLDSHLEAGERFDNLETGEPLARMRDRVVNANVYLGAAGIVDALRMDARIVLTGRVADASLAVGPALFEFDWNWDDWDRLAAATVAGHIIECGAQATGGMFSNWDESISLGDIGYPIAELSADGSTRITKPANTGGIVSTETVAEQLLYEIGDPAHYLTPDVDADFSGVQLQQSGTDEVSVTHARGTPAPETYKVSMAYRDGYAASGTLVICGRDAAKKARASAEALFERVRCAGFNLQETNIEYLGTGDTVPGVLPERPEPCEVVLRVAARDPNREGLERLVRELAPLVTGGPAGVTGYAGARPKPYPVLAYWPTTISRTRVAPIVETKEASQWLKHTV